MAGDKGVHRLRAAQGALNRREHLYIPYEVHMKMDAGMKKIKQSVQIQVAELTS